MQGMNGHWYIQYPLAVFGSPLTSHLSLLTNYLHIPSVLHERLLVRSGESLGFKERVRLRSGAVALQHDFRAVGSIAEVHRVTHQFGSIPFAAAAFIDDKILQDGVRLPVVHRIQTKRNESRADHTLF